jgi:GTP-binding protein
MNGFIDETRIVVGSGKGGDGVVAFRREKYIERGGPNGGDGGRGGNLLFQVRKNLKTFTHLQNRHKFIADPGYNGMSQRQTGAKGEDMIIPVPPGSRIRDYATREILLDFGIEEGNFLFIRGGKGGLGNWHFRSSSQGKQAPRKFTRGQLGQERELLLEMAVIADIGLVGFPNAGKSSLQSALTASNPKIAAYAFTTKIPNLGVLKKLDKELIIADIPGLISGASEGLGLGTRFLKHLTRTKALAFLLDMGSEEHDSLEAYEQLRYELSQYDMLFLNKPQLVVATKMDLPQAQENLKRFQQHYPTIPLIAISIHARQGVNELVNKFWALHGEHT